MHGLLGLNKKRFTNFQYKNFVMTRFLVLTSEILSHKEYHFS